MTGATYPEVDQTLQPYAYATGNPVTGTDPTGLSRLYVGAPAVNDPHPNKALRHRRPLPVRYPLRPAAAPPAPSPPPPPPCPARN